MRIEIRSRNTTITPAIRSHVDEHFETVSKQVPDTTRLELELKEERNPAIADDKIAEVTLHLKGTLLRAREASPDIMHSIDLAAGKLARQVKRHKDKLRSRRRESRPGGPLAESA